MSLLRPISTFVSTSLVGLFALALATQATAQCLDANFGLWPSATFEPACTGSAGIITACGFGSEYSNVEVTSGEIYEFASSVATDYITISNSDGTTAFAWGTTPVVWQATLSGVVRFYTHTDASCPTSSGGCRTKSVLCPAVLPLAPELDITPLFGSVIDFGTGGSDDQLDQTVTAENVGSDNLDLECTISDDDGGIFSLLPSDPFSVTLEPGDPAVSFDVRCSLPTLGPGASASFTGELSCTTNDPDFPGQNTYELACAGDGPSEEPELDITPPFGSTIDFGAGGSGAQLDQTVTIESTGNVDVDLDCTISDSANGVFSLLPTDPISISLAPGADPESFVVSCQLPGLPAGASSSFSGELSCTTNDPEFPGDNTFGLICEGDGGPIFPVPTMGRWGMLVLMLGLLALAGFRLKAARGS